MQLLSRTIVNVLVIFLLGYGTTAWAAQHDTVKDFNVTEVTERIYMLQGKGGNIGVSVGPDGALIVDDDFADMSAALDAKLKALGGDRLRFLLNTHYHFDHVSGNPHFGPKTNIVAHTNARKRLMVRHEYKMFNVVQEALPAEGLPVITFDQALSFHFNGEEIKAVHYPGGHTDGDAVVFFTGSNVVHMGDLYFSGMFPVVDVDGGGNVLRMAKNVKTVMSRLPKDVKIIPGHGPLSTLKDLEAFHRMLQESIVYVREARDSGKTLEQIQAQAMPKQWEAWSKGFLNTSQWTAVVYRSLESQ